MKKAIVTGARSAREDAALTLTEFAAKSKLSIQTLKNIEAGKSVKLPTARKYAKAISLPASAVEVVG